MILVEIECIYNVSRISYHFKTIIGVPKGFKRWSSKKQSLYLNNCKDVKNQIINNNVEPITNVRFKNYIIDV